MGEENGFCVIQDEVPCQVWMSEMNSFSRYED